jgi:PD-(D/E)XK endonuclease
MGENEPRNRAAHLECSVRNAKRRGELVEVAFLHKAVSLGFGAAKPYGDSESYDFILDAREGSVTPLWRVQVKSSGTMYKGAYHIMAAHFTKKATKECYTKNQIDFLVAYIVPETTWYVLPVQVFTPRMFLSFFPHNPDSRGRYEDYRDAWHLMSDSQRNLQPNFL